jgi:hypothetical protein
VRLALLFALFFVAAVALVMILRSSGPRVTHIEHRSDESEGDGRDA